MFDQIGNATVMVHDDLIKASTAAVHDIAMKGTYGVSHNVFGARPFVSFGNMRQS